MWNMYLRSIFRARNEFLGIELPLTQLGSVRLNERVKTLIKIQEINLE